MSRVLLSIVLVTLAYAKPQDLVSNRVAPELNQKIEFANVAPEPAPLVISNDFYYGYGVDFSTAGSLTQMKCLKINRYKAVFIRGFTPEGAGSFDTNAPDTVRNAFSAGLASETYMTPQPRSHWQGWQQADLMIDGFINGGITVRFFWIQVTSPINWLTPTENVNFLNGIVARAKQRGLSVGIYTNQYDWSQITNNWSTIGSDVPLWYWNVYGPGVTGETTPSFDDFRPFGSWNSSSVSVKQFAQSELVCQLTVNRNVYAIGNGASARNSPSIEIGSIGL